MSAALIVAVLAALAGCGSGGSSTEAAGRYRSIDRAFPAPRTGTMEPAAAKAVEAGQAACRGKSPTAVKERFFPAAKPHLEPEQAKMIGRIGTYEAQAKSDRSFVAGQLAADTYAATLSEAAAASGYQGCIYSLARGLEHRLAPRGKPR